MFLRKLQKKKFSFLRIPKNYYETLSPEDYLFNQRDSTLTKNIHKKILLPLKNSNHSEGTTDEIALVGVPQGIANEKFPDEYDTLTQTLDAHHPDLIFLQIDPAPYIARQRFLAHKCALKGLEDYEIHALKTIDPIKPDSWEECVVNLVTLDMLSKNKVFTELDYTSGLATYSYPYLQSDNQASKALTQPFINSITENIIHDQFSPYFLINQALYSGLLGKHKVLLGDMPEPLLRQIVGNTVTIEELRDLFKFILEKMAHFQGNFTIKEVTEALLPHIFKTPRDLFITAMLKESFQAATCIAAMVGIHHFNPIQRYWIGAPHGINYEQATAIPNRIRGETDEILIEKQAIMDVLLETRVWGKKYLSNPFPYLVEDILSVKENELGMMKNCFATNYMKYLGFKNMKLKEYGKIDDSYKSLARLEMTKEETNKIINLGRKKNDIA